MKEEEYLSELKHRIRTRQALIVKDGKTAVGILLFSYNKMCIRDSPQGAPGANGADGADGENGATFTPSLSDEGVLSWTNDQGLQNPAAVSIRGPQGPTGATGAAGADGVTFTPSLSAAGVLTFTNDGNLPNPDPVDLTCLLYTSRCV